MRRRSRLNNCATRDDDGSHCSTTCCGYTDSFLPWSAHYAVRRTTTRQARWLPSPAFRPPRCSAFHWTKCMQPCEPPYETHKPIVALSMHLSIVPCTYNIRDYCSSTIQYMYGDQVQRANNMYHVCHNEMTTSRGPIKYMPCRAIKNVSAQYNAFERRVTCTITKSHR